MFIEPPSIDLEQLKAPISNDLPCGSDPRTDLSPLSVYFSLKDVRSQARSAERAALVDNEPLLSLAHLWDPIMESVPNALVEDCRDLELAAWLIEASIRRSSFKGLALGCDVASVLIENHWHELYPEQDEDGPVSKVLPLLGLNGMDGEGTLLMPIASLPLTELIEDRQYSLWEFEQASDIERLDKDKREQKHSAGAVSLEEIKTNVKASSAHYFSSLLEDIEQAQRAYQRLTMAIDGAVGTPQPSSHITRRLTACKDAVLFLAEDKLAEHTKQNDTSEISGEGAIEPIPDNQSGQVSVNAAIQNRMDAIAQLEKIASFFKQTEPHSPMAYGIEQVVRWSEMTLPDLLQELISDKDARTGYFRLTGIRAEQQE
ncbi:type VI secretion system protein TssA [Vibrio variabilis]|uniref:type VI secretion system protein TssA n=1 Tax=Vibrio variabilis TaxID=990271 RepID=UPI000DD4EFB2|nr:type VI secretion system protein TssA [Vibrio variabilis]